MTVETVIRPMTEERLARIIWHADGPCYQGWPDVGRRVHIGYWDQYPGEKARCFRLAKTILNAFGENEDRK